MALPPLTVDEPSRKNTASRSHSASWASHSSARKRPAASTPAAAQQAHEDGPDAKGNRPKGSVDGYVANGSTTGTKTSTPLIEIPQAISVVGSDQIRDQKPNKLDEVLRYTPGVYAGTFGADTRNDWFLIRGFKSDDTGLFLDGMQLFYTAYASWKLQPWDIERVDILRGPTGMLYGGSSPGGMVNVVSKLPPTSPTHYLETGVDNWGNGYVSFDVGGPVPVTTDVGQFFYRVVGQVKGGGTQTDFTNDDNYAVAPSLTWKPDADTTLTILASASKQNTNGENFLPYVGTVTAAPWGKIPTSLFTSDPSVDVFSRAQEMVGYQFERNLTEDLTFRQNARYAHVDVEYSTLYGLGYATTPAAADLSRGNFLARDSADQADLDTQVEYRFRTGPFAHTALFGVDVKHYDIDDWQGFGAASSINILNPAYTPTQRFNGAPYQNAYLTQNQAGVYLQDQIKWDRWTLVLSGREDWADTRNDNRIGADMSRNDSAFSGRAGLIYTSAIGLAPYVSYSTSFNPIVGTNLTLNQLYQPETATQVETGVKFVPAGFDGYINVAWFDVQRNNVLTTDPNNALLSVQTGQVTSRGVEVEVVGNLSKELKLTGSFTTYDLFVSRDLNPALIGTTPTNTPERLASLWTDYTIKAGPLTGLGFGGGVRYVGPSFADQANTFEVPSRVLGDLAVHYEWGNNWRAAVNVFNVADTTYVASCSSVSACFYGDRRRVLASLSYKW